ncbi:PREDICTED: uncharacterized protein LOC106807609 [Priapulus caudatus]|uniref:Uncharacterized protein LOC106807609 n=1 Tax=Priapulus caudatus TaxID=37621 RepID=A0ABM1DZW7_PRICU|nr:PREDICTED: uncharacterized protein LOC106807609 [Priapulus caudatus]
MAWLDCSRLPVLANGGRVMTTNNHDENLNLKVTDCVGRKRKKLSKLVYELTGHQAAKENSTVQTIKRKKASLLDTEAARTICHSIGKRDLIPTDIKTRVNQGRLLFLLDKAQSVENSNHMYFVQDETEKSQKFRDHKGNWVTISVTDTSLLTDL